MEGSKKAGDPDMDDTCNAADTTWGGGVAGGIAEAVCLSQEQERDRDAPVSKSPLLDFIAASRRRLLQAQPLVPRSEPQYETPARRSTLRTRRRHMADDEPVVTPPAQAKTLSCPRNPGLSKASAAPAPGGEQSFGLDKIDEGEKSFGLDKSDEPSDIVDALSSTFHLQMQGGLESLTGHLEQDAIVAANHLEEDAIVATDSKQIGSHSGTGCSVVSDSELATEEDVGDSDFDDQASSDDESASEEDADEMLEQDSEDSGNAVDFAEKSSNKDTRVASEKPQSHMRRSSQVSEQPRLGGNRRLIYDFKNHTTRRAVTQSCSSVGAKRAPKREDDSANRERHRLASQLLKPFGRKRPAWQKALPRQRSCRSMSKSSNGERPFEALSQLLNKRKSVEATDGPRRPRTFSHKIRKGLLKRRRLAEEPSDSDADSAHAVLDSLPSAELLQMASSLDKCMSASQD